MQHYIIEAQNVKCGGCVATIQDNLQKLPGVQSVSVEINPGRVTVEAEDNVQRATLVDTLASLGYPEKS